MCACHWRLIRNIFYKIKLKTYIIKNVEKLILEDSLEAAFRSPFPLLRMMNAIYHEPPPEEVAIMKEFLT
jgi:hypothetical protein